jgi:hypothetical protein
MPVRGIEPVHAQYEEDALRGEYLTSSGRTLRATCEQDR